MEEMNGIYIYIYIYIYLFFFFSIPEMNGVLQQRVDDQNDTEEMNNVRIAKEKFKMKVKS
jgi:hypothetical protein